MTVFDFLNKRQLGTNQYFASTGASRTVLICSHIWWTELIAYSFLRQGFNVLVTTPWYVFYVDDRQFQSFDEGFGHCISMIRKFSVDLIVGGNTTAMVVHPRTGQMLHDAAGVPLVNYWWDEPRAHPPMSKRGYTPDDYFAALRNENTLNVIWDIDVMEEMARFFNLNNTAHVPLGTTPELWPQATTSLADRNVAACFLGNCHFVFDEVKAKENTAVYAWADAAVNGKLANPDRPMIDCVDGTSPIATGTLDPKARSADDPAGWRAAFGGWSMIGALLMTRCRNRYVTEIAKKLGNDFQLLGTGWGKLNLTAQKDHSGIPAAGIHYGQCKASLNLFGGCVHGGMPLRPYEIASSGGLIFTQYNRELPDLYEPGKECVAFNTVDQMFDSLDRILTTPRDFDAMVAAGRKRTIASHTWDHRVRRLLELAQERFDLPWNLRAAA